MRQLIIIIRKNRYHSSTYSLFNFFFFQSKMISALTFNLFSISLRHPVSWTYFSVIYYNFKYLRTNKVLRNYFKWVAWRCSYMQGSTNLQHIIVHVVCRSKQLANWYFNKINAIAMDVSSRVVCVGVCLKKILIKIKEFREDPIFSKTSLHINNCAFKKWRLNVCSWWSFNNFLFRSL